ncbi:hypothetical protein FAI40_04805 [Acetobacteraceae bacterium]|nr:hypothetical protein FAI40_04805 [Acetobacteraceae bacterium]
MSVILAIILAVVFFSLMVFAVKLSAQRKNRSPAKWLAASFLLPIMPFVLFFMPAYKKRSDLQKEAKEESAEDSDSSQSLLLFVEYIGISILVIFEIFLVWAFNHWLFRPWNGDNSGIVYDQSLTIPPNAQQTKQAKEFLDAFFNPNMTGQPLPIAPFDKAKAHDHCVSLCGYSGMCDQIKLVHCFDTYQMNYESVSTYLQQHYAYPWTKKMVQVFAQKNNREGVLNYADLASQLQRSQSAYERLKKQYDGHQVDVFLLAKAINDPFREMGAPDFAESERIYQKELKLYR